MRDYNLIKYIAKLSGAKPKRDKSYLNCFFPYDKDAVITASFLFEKGKSKTALFDLMDVYGTYGEKKFPSYEKFIDQLAEQSEVFEKFTDENTGSVYLVSDLTVNKLENVASQALMNLSVVTIQLNKLLGREAHVFREGDWRSFHRMYLKKQKLINGCIAAGCFALTVASIIITTINDAYIWVLAFGIPALIASPFFLFKYLYFKRNLKKAEREKNYRGQ